MFYYKIIYWLFFYLIFFLRFFMHELPKLPYSLDALQPIISKETLEFHYGKHHKTYINNLNKLIIGTEFEQMSLEEIIKQSSGGIFNNAAQVWNHSFYWHCLSPNKTEASQKLATAINQSFSSFDEFKQKFTAATISNFGSGWTWLVKDRDSEKLSIMSTSNADTPVRDNTFQPLLTIDVWEHAYYIDYRNDRAKYINNFYNIINWKFVSDNFIK